MLCISGLQSGGSAWYRLYITWQQSSISAWYKLQGYKIRLHARQARQTQGNSNTSKQGKPGNGRRRHGKWTAIFWRGEGEGMGGALFFYSYHIHSVYLFPLFYPF